ncbi:YggT family protein [Candidatus Venteria ishoeyi]|uniref:YGGT family protein n=1 Tax=Candidatus Venteria ishoeyi TaxID=1899563 RepID=A0A1H6F816_9GAMM|nr:YggT family protein [Candidatus Venteria ishoeyi]MDM8548159.1 YggT family protein [Candidatus Venteria ishoeyi]SEH05204.1 YGGT family protein [Candidatus Venteria ishoeyi]
MIYLMQALAFLLDVAFGIYIFMLMLRILLQWAHVDFNHPMTQFLYLVTNPVVNPLRPYIPRWRALDTPALFVMLLLQMLKGLLLALLLGYDLSLLGLLVLSVAELLSLFIYVLIFSLIIEMVLSFISHDPYNPLGTFVYRLNAPLLRPVRQRLPVMHGFDFSGLVVIILLQLALILIVAPITDIGKGL